MGKFANQLSEHLENRGLTRSELAHQLDRSPQYISNILHEHNKPPTLKMTRQIGAVLELDAEATEALVYLAFRERLDRETREIVGQLEARIDSLQAVAAVAGRCSEEGSTPARLARQLDDLLLDGQTREFLIETVDLMWRRLHGERTLVDPRPAATQPQLVSVGG